MFVGYGERALGRSDCFFLEERKKGIGFREGLVQALGGHDFELDLDR